MRNVETCTKNATHLALFDAQVFAHSVHFSRPGEVLGDVIKHMHHHLLRLGLGRELPHLVCGKLVDEICHLLFAHLVPGTRVSVTFCACGD